MNVDYEPLEPITDPETALAHPEHAVHPDHGSNVLYRRKFVWGEVDADFAAAEHHVKLACRWHRNSTVPIETFGVTASWNPAQALLDVWASIQMPKYPDLLASSVEAAGQWRAGAP